MWCHIRSILLTFCLFTFPPPSTDAQDQHQEKQATDLALKDFRPQSMLKNIRQTNLQRAKFPVIDVHTHFGFRLAGTEESLDEFVATMDRHNIAICISLDARLGSTLDEHQKFLWNKHADRFAVFVRIDWQGSGEASNPKTWACHQPGFARAVTEHLKQAKRNGACGLKLTKQFGLGYENPDGSLIEIDDPRWDPIWQACGELNLPVIIHTADPAAFFQPIDRFNERYEELARRPEWSFYGKRYPSREALLAARNRVIERHPNTKFIGAHVANNPEDLKTVGMWLDRYPNLLIEPSSRIAELGRQPYTAREFIIEYQDRILFGTDGPWPELRLTYYWRFFETFDEYFPYSEKQPPPQGLWNIYGIGLQDDVLQKIYYENAINLISGLKEKYSRAAALLEEKDEARRNSR